MSVLVAVQVRVQSEKAKVHHLTFHQMIHAQSGRNVIASARFLPLQTLPDFGNPQKDVSEVSPSV
jgi:hypothetical protein